MSAFANTDKTAYLANVIAIAGMDGIISPAEQRAFKSIAARIGADAGEVAEARRRADDKTFRLAVLADPPARLSNLEDMLMIGLADGQLDERESQPLEQLATSLKFTQVDVDMALRRAQGRLAKLDAMEPAAATPKPPPPQRPTPAVASATRRPTTPAASRTRTMPAPKEVSRFTRRTEPRRTVEHLVLPMVTAPWQRKTIAVPHTSSESVALAPDGAEPGAAVPVATPGGIPVAEDRRPMAPGTSEEPLSVRDACICARAEAADPSAYCYGLLTGDPNVWGCRLAEMPWTAGADWLSCGNFRADGTFVFDREAIAAMLEERLAIAAGCPYLRLNRTEKALAALPSRAAPGPRWTYRQAITPNSGVEIVQRHYIHGCQMTQRIRAEAMDPVGQGDVRRILRDVARQTH